MVHDDGIFQPVDSTLLRMSSNLLVPVNALSNFKIYYDARDLLLSRKFLYFILLVD